MQVEVTVSEQHVIMHGVSPLWEKNRVNIQISNDHLEDALKILNVVFESEAKRPDDAPPDWVEPFIICEVNVNQARYLLHGLQAFIENYEKAHRNSR